MMSDQESHALKCELKATQQNVDRLLDLTGDLAEKMVRMVEIQNAQATRIATLESQLTRLALAIAKAK